MAWTSAVATARNRQQRIRAGRKGLLQYLRRAGPASLARQRLIAATGGGGRRHRFLCRASTPVGVAARLRAACWGGVFVASFYRDRRRGRFTRSAALQPADELAVHGLGPVQQRFTLDAV